MRPVAPLAAPTWNSDSRKVLRLYQLSPSPDMRTQADNLGLNHRISNRPFCSRRHWAHGCGADEVGTLPWRLGRGPEVGRLTHAVVQTMTFW